MTVKELKDRLESISKESGENAEVLIKDEEFGYEHDIKYVFLDKHSNSVHLGILYE